MSAVLSMAHCDMLLDHFWVILTWTMLILLPWSSGKHLGMMFINISSTLTTKRPSTISTSKCANPLPWAPPAKTIGGTPLDMKCTRFRTCIHKWRLFCVNIARASSRRHRTTMFLPCSKPAVASPHRRPRPLSVKEANRSFLTKTSKIESLQHL